MNEGLRAELVAMLADDQSARAAFLADADNHRQRFEATQVSCSETPWPYVILEWVPPGEAPPAARRVLDVIKANTARLSDIVAEHGWPGRSMVGEDGADAAWLVLQHTNSKVTTIRSDAGDEFCRSCLPLLREAVTRGEAHPRHLAAIADSIHLGADETPEFAVLADQQFSLDQRGQPVFRWEVDVEAIDRRRAIIGLAPLAVDIARRRQGQTLDVIGPNRCEPWPP
jgi:hypothetical protein